MQRDTVRSEILRQIHPDRIDELGPGELVDIIAAIWSDVELAALLYGSRQFFWERLLHFARRGYLTAREDQGVRRLLAFSYRRQLIGYLRRTTPGGLEDAEGDLATDPALGELALEDDLLVD